MSRSQHHVVVIDDDQNMFDLLHALLDDANWTITECNRASDALQCVRDASPDVVLLDLHLHAEQNGWDLLRDLSEDHLTARVPVILFTADIAGVRRNKVWLAERGIEVLTKPFELDEVHRLLDAAMARGENEPPLLD